MQTVSCAFYQLRVLIQQSVLAPPNMCVVCTVMMRFLVVIVPSDDYMYNSHLADVQVLLSGIPGTLPRYVLSLMMWQQIPLAMF